MNQICNLYFFDYLTDLFFMINMEGNIVEINKAVEENLGYSLEEIKKKNIKEILPLNGVSNEIFNESFTSKKIPIITKKGPRFFIIKSMKIKQKCTDLDFICIVAKDVEAEEKYEILFNNSIQGIFQSTLDGKYIAVNPAFAKICGYDSPDDMIKIVKDIKHEVYANPDDRDRFVKYLFERDELRDFEGQLLKKNGEKVWVSLSASPIKDDFGNILYIEGIVEDITEKKESFANYKALLNAIPDMMARVRYDGYIIDIKPGEGKYSEVGQSVVFIGSNILDLPFGNTVNEFKRVIDEVLSNGEPVVYKYSIKIGEETRHYYSRTVKNVEDEVIVIVRDVTEETRVALDLKNSKDFAENLMKTANVMIVGLDTNGKVILFNTSAENLTGYKRDEILGRNWFTDIPILSKQDIPRISEVFNHLIGDRLSDNIVENPIITKHGEIKYILWQNNEIRENGKVTGTISFGLDISDRKKSEEELIEAKNKAEQSDKMKLEFLANMSHDLRTPMNSIIGFSDLLKSNNITKHEKNDYINTIINNGKFLMALIDDIIDISKIDSGSLKIENSDFELNKLMEELRLSYSKQIKDKNIEIIIDVDVNKNIIVNTDKYRLRQILMNLIGNAVKFTNDGYVKFGYKTLNSRLLEIYVEDTGPGIERQYQKVIFERFKQIVNGSNKFKGAGLGLSIAKSLVELLGFKEIKLISELEKGSKFYFIVPYNVKPYNYMNEVKLSRNHKRMNFTGKRILVVEDNSDSRLIIRSYLFPTNATVLELSDGNKILDTLKSVHVDLVLLDIGLPGKDGYQVLKEIREFDDRIPVIIESALAMPDQKTKAFDLGCDDFITKPFSREDFLNKIDNLI
jgi:PAS domain S-box-containing protein